MREILFRGKRVDNGEWVEGYYAKYRNISDKVYTAILQFDAEDGGDVYWDGITPVIPETVGQYTGLTDKSGKKIFEGDIVAARHIDGSVFAVGDIQFDCGVFGIEWTHNKKNRFMVGAWGQRHNLRRLDDDMIDDVEVIGNIHDNPELMEDEQ